MATLIDAGLWIDLTRARSPLALKHFVAPYINNPGACIAEPIAFELLRHATSAEAGQLMAQFQNMVQLVTPGDLWSRAAELGQECRKRGISSGSLDLLMRRKRVSAYSD